MPTSKKASKTKSSKSASRPGPVPPYGIAIREAIARGNTQEMRKVAQVARKHVADVTSALAKLEKAIGKG